MTTTDDGVLVVDAGVTADLVVPLTTTSALSAGVAGTDATLACTTSGDSVTVHVPGDVSSAWLPQQTVLTLYSEGVQVASWPVRVIDETRRAQAERHEAERAALLDSLADQIPAIEAIPGPIGRSLADLVRVLTDTPHEKV